MRILLQRVTRAGVAVDDKTICEVASGLLLFLGFGRDDTEAKLVPAIDKVLALRIFPDEKGRFDRSVKEISGDVLIVSQFTLYADTSKGNRPGFSDALAPEKAVSLCERFVSLFRERYPGKVETGRFGDHMAVSLVNDGPVTIMLEW